MINLCLESLLTIVIDWSNSRFARSEDDGHAKFSRSQRRKLYFDSLESRLVLSTIGRANRKFWGPIGGREDSRGVPDEGYRFGTMIRDGYLELKMTHGLNLVWACQSIE